MSTKKTTKAAEPADTVPAHRRVEEMPRAGNGAPAELAPGEPIEPAPAPAADDTKATTTTKGASE